MRAHGLALACVLAGMAAAGCTTTAPPAVLTALEGELEDLARLEGGEPAPGLLGWAPTDQTADFGGKVRAVREGWHRRLRGMMLRITGMLAWARGEEFDLIGTRKRLFAPFETQVDEEPP